MYPRSLASICLALSVAAGAASCGDVSDDTEAPIELSQLDGLDVPADYAGGVYVKMKGTLTLSRAKSGVLTGREKYHGFTYTAKRGETLRVRGVAQPYMTLVSVYGPQTADGKWGSQLQKRWLYRPLERKQSIIEYKTTKAGKYLVVMGVSNMDSAGESHYALTLCNGECAATTCVDFSVVEANYNAVNFVNRAEADVAIVNYAPTSTTVRSGSCGSQSRACTRERAPVCASIPGGPRDVDYSNLCLAKVAFHDYMADDLGPKALYAPKGACGSN